MTVSMLRSLHPAYQNWLYYWWGEQVFIIGYGLAHLVRSTVQNTGLVAFLPLDLVVAGSGDLEPDSQTMRDQDTGRYKFTRIWPNKYFGSPVDTSQPPPVDPPPIEPPPVEPPVTPPVVIPPVVTPTKYKIKNITRGNGLPLIVFFGVANNLPCKLVAPNGREQSFTTGGKPEYGAGGTEAGYAVQTGDYALFIDNDKYVINMRGEFAKIEFELATDTPPAVDVVIATGYMDLSKALRVIAAANEIARQVVGKDVFRVE